MMEIQRGFDVIGGGGTKPVIAVEEEEYVVGRGRRQGVVKVLNKIWRSGEERRREREKGEEVFKKKAVPGLGVQVTL